MGQPAEQGKRGSEQDGQPGAEMPQKVFIGMGRGLDRQAAVVGFADDDGFLHDGYGKVRQPGEPVGAVGTLGRRVFAQDVAVRRGVFHIPQVAAGDRAFQVGLQGVVIAQDGQVDHALRQRGKLGRGLVAQCGVRILTNDLQRLLPHEEEHGHQNEQKHAQHAALGTEAGAQTVHKAFEEGGGIKAHTEGIGRIRRF